MLQALTSNVLFIQFVVLIGLVIADTAAAVALAIATKEFDWSKFLTFLKQGVLAYTIVWAVLAGIAYGATYLDTNDGTLASVAVFVNVIYAAIIAKLIQSITGHLKVLGITKDGQISE